MPVSRRKARTASGSAAWTASSPHWQEVFAINFFAPVFFSRTLAKRLQEGEGSIVNITSIAGHRVHPFAGSAYSTSKAALWGLTRELAADLAPTGHPGQRGLPGRDQHRDPLARHRSAGLPHPDAPPGLAGRGRGGDLLSVQPPGVLRDRRRDPGQRRPGRVLTPARDSAVPTLRPERARPRSAKAALGDAAHWHQRAPDRTGPAAAEDLRHLWRFRRRGGALNWLPPTAPVGLDRINERCTELPEATRRLELTDHRSTVACATDSASAAAALEPSRHRATASRA